MKQRGFCLPILGLLALTWTAVLAADDAPTALARVQTQRDTRVAVHSVDDMSVGKQTPRVKLVLAGSVGPNRVAMGFSRSAGTLTINSNGSLEIGTSVCSNPPGRPNQLICDSDQIVGVQVNAWTGDDRVRVSPNVLIPVVLFGGPGDDFLAGGGGADRLNGGSGRDVLVGHAGRDTLFGGPQNDAIFGGPGNDLLFGGQGNDLLFGGMGRDRVLRRNRRPGRKRVRRSASSGTCCVGLPASP